MLPLRSVVNVGHKAAKHKLSSQQPGSVNCDYYIMIIITIIIMIVWRELAAAAVSRRRIFCRWHIQVIIVSLELMRPITKNACIYNE